MQEWLSVIPDNIPEFLQQYPRWVLWSLDGSGRKSPRSAHNRLDRAVDATKPKNWSSFQQAAQICADKRGFGLGFALGSVVDGPTFAGVDLDNCRDPKTGQIEEWAWNIISTFQSYTEISPSGRGVKIFCLGTLPEGATHSKVYKLEMYDSNRYFTVTGHHLAGTPTTIEPRQERLQNLHAWGWSRDLRKLLKLFGFVLLEDGESVYVKCPWADHHSTPDKIKDAKIWTTDGKVSGFSCLHTGCADKTIGSVYAFFGIKGGEHGDFITDHNGKILKDNQQNILLALDKFRIKVSHDIFSNRYFISEEGHGLRVLDDEILRHLWFEIDTQFHFRPSIEFFKEFLYETGDKNRIHPVRKYLDDLVWDGKPRLDTWLIEYGGAKDTEYVRRVGAIVLIAAVRRIRIPGCKFDELLIIESAQGLNKSSALRALCKDDSWFSDDLPLNVGAKEIIERTSGKWIIEAAELAGSRTAQVEHLKSMLSRQVDGPVRMAYARVSVERARSFIIIGTTNSKDYLKDSTGARRFWPVAVPKFNLEEIRKNRDQLWAEASIREKDGESIRLPERLWPAAGIEQEERRERDPWEEILANADIGDRCTTEDIWELLGIPIASRDSEKLRKIRIAMERLGYEGNKAVRAILNSDGSRSGKVVKGWIKKNLQGDMLEDSSVD